MANAQTFTRVELNEQTRPIVSKLMGQASTVWNALVQLDRPVTGIEVNDYIEENTPYVSRKQDPLRITLYYLVIFKSKGLVTAERPKSAKRLASEHDKLYDLAGI